MTKNNSGFSKYIMSLLLFLLFEAVAVTLWLTKDNLFYLLNFSYIQEVSQMNQTTIGSYITKKRREKNLTQEQLAEKLGVSNKTISKWENGKCMPDYSIIEQLCKELSVTLSELMDGEDATEDSMRVYDYEQILDLLRRMQELERQKNILYGIILIVLGIDCNAMAGTVSGSEVQEFISGLLTGLSVAEILAGIVVVGKSVLKR